MAVEGELVRVVARELRAVRHDEGGRLARGEEGEEALLEAGLAGGGWLVGDDQRRRGGGAAREVEARGGEALPLAAGEGAACGRGRAAAVSGASAAKRGGEGAGASQRRKRGEASEGGGGDAEVWPRLVELGAACGEPLEPGPRQSLQDGALSAPRPPRQASQTAGPI